MARLFEHQPHGYADPVIFDAGPRYSMGVASQILRRRLRRLNRVVKPLVKAGLGSPLPIGLGAVVSNYGEGTIGLIPVFVL